MVSLHHLIDAFFASEWRGFAIGFFTAGGMALFGRRFPFAAGRFLAAGSATAGTLAGWLALLARDLTSGGGNAAHLLVVALAAAVIGAVPPARAGKAGRNGAARAIALAPAGLLGLALLLGAWWLGGTGRNLAAVIGAWRGEGVVLIAAGLTGIPLFVLLRAASAPVHWPLAAAAASLAAALTAIGFDPRAAGLALALAGAALGAGIGAGRAGGDDWRCAAAMTATLALLVGAVILGDGPVAHGAVHARPGPVLMIPLGPLATLWLARRLTRRFSRPVARRLGGVALAHVLALAVISLLGFSLAALAGLR